MWLNLAPLYTEREIKEKVLQLGQKITEDYRHKAPLRVIGALKGCFVFMADLIRAIDLPVKVDFLEVSSYGDEMKSSGNVKITKDLTHDIAGEHVLFAEDIVDTGLTLNFVMDMLMSRKPLSLEICALLAKPQKMQIRYPIKYIGFEIGDEFVVGYGLDYRGFGRNIPYIAKLSESDVKRFHEIVAH